MSFNATDRKYITLTLHSKHLLDCLITILIHLSFFTFARTLTALTTLSGFACRKLVLGKLLMQMYE